MLKLHKRHWRIMSDVLKMCDVRNNIQRIFKGDIFVNNEVKRGEYNNSICGTITIGEHNGGIAASPYTYEPGK